MGLAQHESRVSNFDQTEECDGVRVFFLAETDLLVLKERNGASRA